MRELRRFVGGQLGATLVKRGKPGPGYLARGVSAADLIVMDRIYAAWSDGKPVLFTHIGSEKYDVYWGTGSAAGLARLGCRGKLWALSLLLVQHAGLPAAPRAIGKELVAFADAHCRFVLDNPPVRGHTEYLETVLTNLISEVHKDSCPDPRLAPALLETAIAFCVRRLFGGDEAPESTAFRRAAAAEPASITDYLHGLLATLPEFGADDRTNAGRPHGEWVSEVSRIDPVIAKGIEDERGAARRYMPATPDDKSDPHARKLAIELRENQLVLVNGDHFCGKKARIKTLLRCIAGETDRLTFPILNEMDGRLVQRLPVRMISAQNVSFQSLVEEVVQFLKKYHAAFQVATRVTGAAEVEPLPATPAAGDIDATLQWVSENCGHLPALYIFTDTDAFRFDHARNAVRDSSILKLVRTLNRTSRFSRVILTTLPLPASGKERKAIFGTLRYRALTVHPRSAQQLSQMLSTEVQNDFPSDLNAQLRSVIRGDDLIALAAVFSLGMEKSTASQPLREKTDRIARNFLRQRAEARGEARAELYAFLAELVEMHGLLHPIALIAACEDGLQNGTLDRLLNHWSRYDPTLEPRAKGTLENRLRDFRRRTGKGFLNLVPLPRFDLEEYDFREAPDRGQQLWEIETMVSVELLRAIRDKHADLVLSAHRLIAREARDRAQLKKVFMRAPFGTRVSEDLYRDVQAYVNLLAGIPRNVPNGPKPDQPLRLSETNVFSVDPGEFDPVLALRFAALSLLKEDIDHDHRLSMIYDEDALRLEMYLRLFQPLGEVHATMLTPLDIPESLPGHMTGGIFSADELLDILTTVALSAFHAQRFSTVEGVVKLATTCVEELGRADLVARLSRIWCCQLDARILLGGTVNEATGHGVTLKLVDDLLRDHFSGMSLPVAETGSTQSSSPSEFEKAYMRLLSRQADLTWLVGSRTAAEQLYSTLERWEGAFASDDGRHDPVVLSGRVARRYLRFLLMDPLTSERMPVGTEEQDRRTRILAKAGGLLTVNISRLRRFSGADRVGVMLDLARLNAAQLQYDKACLYADAAERRAYAGNVSDGGRMDVLVVLADVHLCALSQGLRHAVRGLTADKLLRTVREALEELRTIVDGRDYRPARGTMLWLQARLALADFRLAERRDYARARRAELLDTAFTLSDDAKEALSGIHDRSLDERLDALTACLRTEQVAFDREE